MSHQPRVRFYAYQHVDLQKKTVAELLHRIRDMLVVTHILCFYMCSGSTKTWVILYLLSILSGGREVREVVSVSHNCLWTRWPQFDPALRTVRGIFGTDMGEGAEGVR